MATSEQNAQQIAANTQAIGQINQALNLLVSEFIRPNSQQHLQSLERLARIEGIVEAVSEQVASNAETVMRFGEHLEDTRALLEDTRALVAENASMVAQLGVKQAQNAEAVIVLTAKQDRNSDLIERNGQQIEALAELTRSQLAGIIGNGRRIDRLEQQAS